MHLNIKEMQWQVIKNNLNMQERMRKYLCFRLCIIFVKRYRLRW